MKTGDGPQSAGRIPNTLKFTVFAGTRKYIFLRRITATTNNSYNNKMAANSEAVKIRDIVRSKDPMTELCKNRLITPEACDWVKSALDPFHDLQLESLRGYPDVSTEPTVVVKIRQAVAVAAPAGLTAGQSWDCHICTSPIDFMPTADTTVRSANVTPFGPGKSNTGPVATSAAGLVRSNGFPGTGRMDGLIINSVPSDSVNGRNLTFTPEHCPEGAGSGYQLQQLNLDQYLDFDETDLGVYRIIYSGFEVVNTTAQIYKQGAVTVYEYGNSYEMGASVPAQHVPLSTGDEMEPVIASSQPTTYFRCPPNTLAEAKIMPGSHSWAAQDGCYNTAKFQSTNPFQAMTRRPWIVCQNNVESASESGYGPSGGAASKYNNGSFISDRSLGRTDARSLGSGELGQLAGPVHFSQMNTTGAYFTGLSEQTTLFVTWRVGIERLPAANKPSFLALSQPSACYDPNALVLYNLVANVLPPGCPQGYNDAGKWFRWISEAAQKSIPTVYPIVRTAAMLASAMGRPIIGGALTGLSQAMRPVAEAQAATRLQNAARKKQQSNKPKGKAAVANWSRPTPRGVRSGGTNGLG